MDDLVRLGHAVVFTFQSSIRSQYLVVNVFEQNNTFKWVGLGLINELRDFFICSDLAIEIDCFGFQVCWLLIALDDSGKPRKSVESSRGEAIIENQRSLLCRKDVRCVQICSVSGSFHWQDGFDGTT